MWCVSIEITPSHAARVGDLEVRRALPRRERRTIGAWFEARVSMLWNFVAREHAEIDEAVRQWQTDDGRFGHVASSLPRIPSPTPPWRTSPIDR